jgi:hypothetical protein
MATSRPNFFVDPVPWNQVRVAGLLIKATAVAFKGLKIEDSWKKQKSKEANGAVFSFSGTDPVGGEQGFSITWRITSSEEFDQLYDLYDALKPVPVAGGGVPAKATPDPAPTKAIGSPTTTPTTAESLLTQAQNALQALNSPTPAATSTEPAAAAQSAATPQPSPGPRPPTVPIELGWLAFLGVFAVARRHWEFSAVEDDKIEVTIGFVVDRPPTPAGAGAMSAPTAPSSGGASVPTGFIGPTPVATATANASAGAAGT